MTRELFQKDHGHDGGALRVPLAGGVTLVVDARVSIAVSECHGRAPGYRRRGSPA